eukprot:m.334020 g.334020  ORF g.334020 m.334020 type:complete len:188 (+) comp17270_c0_seq1:130-693(+)
MGGFDFKHLIWMLFLVICTVLFAIAFSGPDWINDRDSEQACGVIAFCLTEDDCKPGGGERYGSFNNIPFDLWKATAVLLGLGLAFLALAALGALVTMIPAFQTHQGAVHNLSAFAAILIFIGLILFCVGFKDMGCDSNCGLCEFCNEDTNPFVLVDCKLGRDLIITIIGVVLVSITSCLGYTVNHDD